MDFEIPLFDEDDGAGSSSGKHESSHLEVVKFQKAMFEKLRQEQVKMRQRTAAIGSQVFTRMLQCNLAKEWEETELEKAHKADHPQLDVEMKSDDEAPNERVKASEVLKELEREGRARVTMKLGGGSKPSKKRKLHPLSLE